MLYSLKAEMLKLFGLFAVVLSIQTVWCISTTVPTEPVYVRLNGSSVPGEGRLELYVRGQWGTVCDDLFDDNASAVACFMLGYGRRGQMIYNRHGPGVGQIWLDDVQCSGSESSLVDCVHNDWGVNNCVHNEDVSVSCVVLNIASSTTSAVLLPRLSTTKTEPPPWFSSTTTTSTILYTDINECNTSTHGCQQTCVNTPGSYYCSCLPGFTLDVNGKNCADVDECSTDTVMCPESTDCENTIGSFVCIKYRETDTNKWPPGAIAAAVVLGVVLLMVAILTVIIAAVLLTKNRALKSEIQSLTASHISAAGQESRYNNGVQENYNKYIVANPSTAGTPDQNEGGYMELAINMSNKPESVYEGLKKTSRLAR